MAKMEISGMDELIATLTKADVFDEKTQEEMLFAAGDILVEELRHEVGASRFRLEGMIPNVKYDRKVKKNKSGDPYIAVSVKGKHKNGQPNARIVFVLNYGRSEEWGAISGGYFWTKGSKNAERRIQKAMEEIAARRLQEGGLS